MKILLIEDNIFIGELIQKMLRLKKYQVHWLRNGIEVMEYLSDTSYDILLVDWMLPKRSGLEIIKEIRDKNINIPIIMLTAKSQTADKVSGLNIGADDYLTKPFEFEELEARILANVKRFSRTQTMQQNTKKIGNITYHYNQHQFTINQRIIDLTLKEYQLLELLFLYEVVPRNLIIEKIWNIDQVVTSNNVIEAIKSIPDVIDVHEFHLWEITTDQYSLSAHVILDSRSSIDAFVVINEIEDLLKEKYGISHTTIQIEHLDINHLNEPYFEKVKENIKN
ncbi:response regulator [Staphylococcus warneri]|uniref:response regulator transcription factor n=3 Tax=Staphylococcus warneri TaxID=1292 RepID=UPI001F268FCC|nr:response regulator transcription factor [Staphylococcus warneri]MCE5013421.1 response regulator [Staphylococcus warneri]